MKDKVAEVLGLSHSSLQDLQHEIHGLDIIETYRKLSIEKSQTDGYYLLLELKENRHLEILKVILEFQVLWMKMIFN